MARSRHIFFLSFFLFYAVLYADSSQRSNVLLNGNKITTEMWNYGSFSSPGNRTTDFVWNGLGYAYEIGFYVGAEVVVPQGSHKDVFQEPGTGRWVAHIISDGMKSNGGEVSPDGLTRWGWQPIASNDNNTLDYFSLSDPGINGNRDADLNGDDIPDGWPQSWWNADMEKYSWPGLWGWDQQIVNSEKVFGMDDRDNKEFKYYPFANDSSRQGLGVEVEMRTFQAADFYDDVIFVTFDITNISDKNLDKMLFGLWGDPHIGGVDDWRDDWQSFDFQRQMVYAWDADGLSNTNPGITPGYFGISFMQTPGNDNDGIDNDNDGMTDEAQNDGIDNDGDWDAEKDDLGADGIAGTSDTGEGDGIPTLGEPAFEYKDMDEADMLGITSFRSPPFSGINISDDEKMWQMLSPGKYDTLDIQGDYVLMGGSAYFSLKKKQTIRVGFVFAMGQDLQDLDNNVDYASIFYHDQIGSQVSVNEVSISKPGNDEKYTNSVEVQWDPSGLAAETELLLSYWVLNRGWTNVTSVSNTGSYSWNTEGLPSSAFYKIRLRAVQPLANALGESNGYFIIDQSGGNNAAPEVYLDFSDKLSVKDDFTVKWLTGDADGDALDLSLILSSDAIQDTIPVTGASYLLDTKKYPNGLCSLILIANDGQSSAQTTKYIHISNDFPAVPENAIVHIAGFATGIVRAEIVEEAQLINDTYFISINDTSGADTYYSVFDSLKQVYLINRDRLPEYPNSGRLFDGMRLSFENNLFQLNTDESGWSSSTSTNMDFNISRENGYAEDPYDYEIRFYNQTVDTTVNNIWVNFIVTDLDNNEQMKTAASGSASEWHPGDALYILRGGSSTSNIVWKLESFYTGSENNISPGEGDIYYLRTDKPFTISDRYVLSTATMDIKPNQGIQPRQPYLEQNYPNPFNNNTTIVFTLPQISQAELEIFDVSGQKVKTLFRGEAASGQHRLIWDGRNTQGRTAASGLYFYRLMTNRGSVVKKLILMK